MAAGSNRKESPAEPFKRVLGLAVRAIAGDGEVQVTYAPGKPEIDGKQVQLPEPSRVPSQREVAVIRGWADSLALTAARHDAKLHSRLAPKSGPAKSVFEAMERARVEAFGANRMPGMAANLTARVEDQYAHGRFADVTERTDAPLEDALALLVRERLTGAAPPASAKAMVDLWRPWVEERAGKTLARLNRVADDQALFGRVLGGPSTRLRPRGAKNVLEDVLSSFLAVAEWACSSWNRTRTRPGRAGGRAPPARGTSAGTRLPLIGHRPRAPRARSRRGAPAPRTGGRAARAPAPRP
jgi:hypothetical protein